MSALFKDHVSKIVEAIDGVMDQILKIPTDGRDDRAQELGFIMDTLNDARESAKIIIRHEDLRNAVADRSTT